MISRGSPCAYCYFQKNIKQVFGRKATLICGAGTRMGSFFHEMARVLHLNSCLDSEVQCPEHINLVKTTRMMKACIDVKNHKIWNAMYVLCAVCHGPILILRFSDANKLVMDKVFIWSYCTCIYIKKNENNINEVDLFSGDSEEDGNFEEKSKMFSGLGKI